MKADIIVIGGGASGLMAACHAARTLVEEGSDASVVVLEKMSRPARKVMITGKGRCNFTNRKSWDDFSRHIRSNPLLVKTAFYGFSPDDVISFFEENGVRTVVERGDRAFPESYRASDIVDALVLSCHRWGVKIETDSAVTGVGPSESDSEEDKGFDITLANGIKYTCRVLILSTGGLSYPSTGSSGDGLLWASALGHKLSPTFPSLTALVPVGYKQGFLSAGKGGEHIDRSTSLSPFGKQLCGCSIRNVEVSLIVGETLSESAFGDVDFTDGGIEGPVGFSLSRKAVKSMINGSKAELVIDLKPAVPEKELFSRVEGLLGEVLSDKRSLKLKERQKMKILLGKLMPWDLIPAFIGCLDGFSPKEIARSLKAWRFPLAGYVGYERAVVTAGGVSVEDVVPKTMSSRLVRGLYFCGEILDADADTGGYNLQMAFSTGALAGKSAAGFILKSKS